MTLGPFPLLTIPTIPILLGIATMLLPKAGWYLISVGAWGLCFGSRILILNVVLLPMVSLFPVNPKGCTISPVPRYAVDSSELTPGFGGTIFRLLAWTLAASRAARKALSADTILLTRVNEPMVDAPTVINRARIMITTINSIKVKADRIDGLRLG